MGVFCRSVLTICNNQHLRLAMARICMDMGIFEALEDSKESVSLEALAQKTAFSSGLIGQTILLCFLYTAQMLITSYRARILRYLFSQHMITETSKGPLYIKTHDKDSGRQ